MYKIKIIILLLCCFNVFSQNEIKTVHRPDGVTMKYFNPTPVAITNSHEAGLALYKNMNTKQYFLTITVLFKQDIPSKLYGNLLIQTTSNKGISLSSVFNKKINMNGREVATSMYLLTSRDIQELKIHPIKMVSFNSNGQITGLNTTQNKNLIINEFLKLK